MNENQKSIATGILRIFCIGVGWQALGSMTIPVFFPLLAKEYEVTGIVTGLILAMSPLMTIVSVPFIHRYIETVGVEATIFTSGLIFSAAFCLMAFASWTTTSSSFLAIAFTSAALVGISIAASIVGE